MGAVEIRTDDSGSSAAVGTVLSTDTLAEAEASPAVEDLVAIRASTLAKSPNIAAAAAAPAPLAVVAGMSVTFTAEVANVAVVGMSVTFPTEEANVAVAVVSFIGPIPAIASS